ncbi:MAG: nucleotide exchange factor GrpE [Thermoplasmata archaeon]|nr:nucleotide exchange factor GrpE [Thermoplasmata archaeon]
MPDEVNETPPSEPRPPPPDDAPPASPDVAEDWASRYRYLLADFENFRRRTEKSREAVTRQARAGVIRELLPIFEASRSARAAVAPLPATDPVRHGIELLDREWSTFLKHEGVEPIAVVGQPFRPDEEEAVGEAPMTPEVSEGAVTEIVQQGYRFYGGVLRPAKVVVARAPPDAGTEVMRTEEAP